MSRYFQFDIVQNNQKKTSEMAQKKVVSAIRQDHDRSAKSSRSLFSCLASRLWEESPKKR